MLKKRKIKQEESKVIDYNKLENVIFELANDLKISVEEVEKTTRSLIKTEVSFWKGKEIDFINNSFDMFIVGSDKRNSYYNYVRSSFVCVT